MIFTFATIMTFILPAIGLVALAKSVLLGAISLINAVLVLIATIAVWKSYLVTGAKVLMTLLVLIPIVGILVYMVWGRKKVDAA